MIIRISCLILCSLLAISAAPGENRRHPVPFLLKGLKNDNQITIHSAKELPQVGEAYFVVPSHLPKEDRLALLEHLVEQNYVNNGDNARRGGENYLNDDDDEDEVNDFDDYEDDSPPRIYEDEYDAELEDDDDDEEDDDGNRGNFENFDADDDDDDDDDNDDEFEHRISVQTFRVSGGLQGLRKTPVALGRKTLNEDVESGRSNGRRRRNQVRRRRRQRIMSQRRHRRLQKRVRRLRKQRRRKETRRQRLERRRLRQKRRRALRARRKPRRFVA